jgi:hypothetical protein
MTFVPQNSITMAALEAATQQARVCAPTTLFAAPTRRCWVAGSSPAMVSVGMDRA